MTWKKIIGFQRYAISSTGHVKNLLTKLILKPKQRFDGYLELSLTNGGKPSSKKIHRLMAENFLTKPEGTGNWIVNHKDNDRTNNNVSNLEWITKGENNKKENQNDDDEDDNEDDYENVSKDRTFSSRAYRE